MSHGATAIGGDSPEDHLPHWFPPVHCRLSEIMDAWGAILDDPMMQSILQSGILVMLRQEFDKHRPSIAILGRWERLGHISSTAETSLVKQAAGIVYDWLSDEGAAALGFLRLLRIGQAPWSFCGSALSTLSFSDAVGRFESGMEGMSLGCGFTKAHHQAMVGSSELCVVDAMLEDAVSTLDYIQRRPPALGPRDVAVRRYECNVGNARVAFFSELHSMESYRQASMQSFRQGVAVSRHAETILASSRVLSPDGVGDADGVPSLVDASSDADSFVGGESSSSGSSSALAAASRHAEPILASSQALSLDGVEACWAAADAAAAIE